ncbi:hypothetical protein [Variovorax sp. YR752]|uniref:hypothetical protein n=1 Tax=Variovorax sp. YR752 TaxID=1884383 RepID=UPI003137B140
MTQVIDFIHGSLLPRKWAANPDPRWIKHLAHLWAGSAQSYPQSAGKAAKVSSNQQLGGTPSRPTEHCRLSETVVAA